MKTDESVLVLLSGGQDSTTCLYWAKKHFNKVFALGFDYNQKHKIELEQAKKIASNANVHYHIFELKNIFSSSSLTNTLQTNHYAQSSINEHLPASFVSGRNLLFLNMAISYGAHYNIKNYVLGATQVDYSGYPDCRRTTLDALQLAFSLGSGLGDVQIITPLMYLNKAEIWKMAKELDCIDIIINDTMTDYNGSLEKNEWGYGTLNNQASQLRANGYYEAKQLDYI